MAEYPLLIFPEPARAERENRFGGAGRVRFPDAERQAERLKGASNNLNFIAISSMCSLESHSF